MSKPTFSRKRKGKKVDPYPLGGKEPSKTSQTKGNRGRPRKLKEASWTSQFKKGKAYAFLYGEDHVLLANVMDINRADKEVELEVLSEEEETVSGEWLERGETLYVHDYEDVRIFPLEEEEWKEAIDYDVRNLSVGDEEETRLYEDRATVKDRLEGYTQAGVNPEDVQLIADQLWLLHDAGALSWEQQYEAKKTVLGVLEGYMTHKALYDANDAVWEEAFFLSQDSE